MLEISPGLSSHEFGHEESPLPERQQIPERVTVIGGGIAGITAAWVMSEAGYGVTIIEQLPDLMQGTSAGAMGIHLGGRYPKDTETAKECLQSAILTKKLMPFAINKKLGRLRFLVADTSDVDLEQYIAFYSRHRDYYASLPPEDQVFGPPEAFFRRLNEKELKNFINVQGGIATQEPCWDMTAVHDVLSQTLAERGVQRLTGTRVDRIEPRDGKYAIDWTDGDGRIGQVTSDVVINTAGYGARELSEQLGDAPQQNLQLRFFNDAKVSKETVKRYPFPFVMIPGYMHYVPMGDSTVSIMGFTEILDKVVVPAGEPLVLPDAWQKAMRDNVIFEDARARQIVDTARSRFMPHIGKAARSINMKPGVAISSHQEQHIKQQTRPQVIEGLPGYLTLVPTKASHGLSLALEAAGIVMQNSRLKGTVGESDAYTQEVLSGRNIAYRT